MRITFLLPLYPRVPVGGYKVVYEYANRLASTGHHVTVVYSRELRRPGVPLRRRLWSKDALRWTRETTIGRRLPVRWHELHPDVDEVFVGALREGRIPESDVLVSTAWWTALRMHDLPPRLGRHASLVQHYETWDGDQALVDLSLRLPGGKVAIARWLQAKLHEVGVPTEDIRYIPNGIDHDHLKVLVPIGGRPAQILTLGHPSEWKGSRLAVAAMDKLRSRGASFDAVMFGTMSRPQWLPAWVTYEQAPSPDRLVRLYNESSIYLCASFGEGWHLPPAEALACGCAVVSTDIEGVADYCIDEVTASLSNVGDADGLANRLASLLEDEPRRTALATAGNGHIRTFTWERATASFERFCRDLSDRPQ